MTSGKFSLLAIASLVLALSGSAAHALIAVDNSGTLLPSGGSLASSASVTSVSPTGALTLEDVSSATTPLLKDMQPSSTQLFTIPSENPSVPQPAGANAPTAVLFAPEAEFSSPMMAPASDFFVTGNEVQPVPEPSTWFVAILCLATIFYLKRQNLRGAFAFCFARH